MLDVFLLSAIVLQAATVEVVPARVSVVTNEARLHQICGVEGKLSACSLFVGYRLKATCATDSTGWRISASAQFMPLMYLLEGRAMAHEYNHIDDVRKSVERHLVELEQKVFPTAEVCQEAAGLGRSDFQGRMQQFARDSHFKWHPRSNLRFLGQQ